jgi:Zn-dependent alcohol dehydrogenase
MRITGAVLEEVGRQGPFSTTHPITVQDLELDPPGENEVLVRIEAAGLCHSDLSVVDGNRPRPVPMLLGHESAGIVEEVGTNVGDLHAGQRVIMTFLPRCGQCKACATGGIVPCEPGSAANNAGTLLNGNIRLRRGDQAVHHHLGVSGFASYAVVDHRSVVAVADDVPPEVAAVMGCAVLTGGGAVLNVGRPRRGDTVAIVGLGGVGMAALLTALGEPDIEVIAVDPIAAKRQRATELGAHRSMTPEEAIDEGITADVVVEAAGNTRAFETAVTLAGPGGRTVTVGLPPPDARASISPLALVAQGRAIIGSYLGSSVPSRDIPVFVDRWRQGSLPVAELVSSRIALKDVNAAMDELASGNAIRQLLLFE